MEKKENDDTDPETCSETLLRSRCLGPSAHQAFLLVRGGAAKPRDTFLQRGFLPKKEKASSVKHVFNQYKEREEPLNDPQAADRIRRLWF